MEVQKEDIFHEILEFAVSVVWLGIAFGIVRLKTGSLWSTIFLHSMWNAFGMVIIVLSAKGILH